MNPALSEIARRVSAAGRIEADDVLAMRSEVYGPPQVQREDVEALIALDGAVQARSPGWGGFLGDALADYVVHQQDPADYVDDAKAAWLTGVCAGALSKEGGCEALVRVLEAAADAPASLETFVLGKVKDAVIAGGAVGAADAALLRRLVFAGGGEGNIGVTREEADALFDVDHACGATADPAWAAFFAQAIDDALTAVSPFRLESREAAKSDDAWLASRPGLFGFLRQMAARPDVGGALDDVLHPYEGERQEWAGPERQMEADEAAAAPITDEEAAWLTRRLGEAPLSAAGRSLIERLQAQAPDIGAKLKPLTDAA